MDGYNIIRRDTYAFTILANSIENVKQKLDNEDFLSTGSYLGSDFEIEEENGTEPRIIYAEEGEDFQEYAYSNGGDVPSGEPIGIEMFKDGEWKIKLLSGILYRW